MNRITVPLSALCIVIAGCAAPEAQREPLLELPPVSTRAFDGPPPTITIHPTGAHVGRLVEVSMTVPSGGHRLRLDHGDVIEGEALLFLTLEQPGSDEAVTMALETLRAEFETDRRFEVTKVHLRSHRRGDVSPAEYRLATERRLE